jgi:chitin synthase
MFSSFLQYLCLAPSFTNVLNVYAFCNLHDVSWGTKGSDKVDALPSVSSKKDADATVVEDKAQVQADVDAAFKETVTRALKKEVKAEKAEKPTVDDENKTFRTRLVALWVLSNAGLAVAIENVNGLQTDADAEKAHLAKKQNTYFAIILYSTFVLALIRFLGVRHVPSSQGMSKLTSCSSVSSTS